MHRQASVQHPTSLPSVFILTPKSAPSALRVPSTKEKYDHIVRRTRSRITHNADPPPPRVDKETDPGPIVWRNRSQTTSMENIITPAKAVT